MSARTPPERIETPRMIVRCWRTSDVPLFEAAVTASLTDLGKWTPWVIPDPANPNAANERLAGFRDRFALGEQFAYGLFDRAETRVLGGAGLFARVGPDALEVGYWTRSDFAGQGYASEAARALTDVAFRECHVSRVEIHCEEANAASAAIPRRLGFQLREIARVESRVEGREPVELMIFEMHASASSHPAAGGPL